MIHSTSSVSPVDASKKFLLSLFSIVKAYPWVVVLYVALVWWMSFELNGIGLWIAGCVSQTALCAVSVHLLLCIGDFDLYASSTKPQYCESCNMWFRVEFLLLCVHAVLSYAVAPHVPFSLAVIGWLIYEVVVYVFFSEARTLDALTIYKTKSALVRACAIKLTVYGVMFLLFMAYVGPMVIMNEDDSSSEGF
mmetsp:Transcript_42434/g.49144  ORF Transcript_42434/g.49144 Transcript_42434/m.49144 type:complete len:193 (+) Transcript_42434:79-657(+)|eukprot:CAMPEP_0176450474 /NCGR_PEP_ID=MMETSP0127-20121128/27173_1 /TAXON_ID=938130 /ORGANISM="Platyophrya macrostoma, Strain WH" /LENGTH=192 /DNA_ID=CAMNT_0017838167 /DNA_START=71 /DNA_END=649 /DNA_ORIENTATION=-